MPVNNTNETKQQLKKKDVLKTTFSFSVAEIKLKNEDYTRAILFEWDESLKGLRR